MTTTDLVRLFERQHGVAADRQLRALDVTWAQQQRLIANGTWVRKAAGVVAVMGAPRTWLQSAMSATLSLGDRAMLSGAPAARLHGLDGFLEVPTIEVVVPYGGHERSVEGVRVRRSRKLSRVDRHVVQGIPVTIQPVTLIHLAADRLNVEKALDSSLRQGKSPLWLRQHLRRWQTHGSVGPREVLELLDQRMGKRLPRSWFQRLAHKILADEGIRLVDEWPVRDTSGALLAELDLADVVNKVGVECQSVSYHATAADIARDIERKRMLRRLGWEIVELWWSDLNRMDEVVTDVRAAIARARQVTS